MNGIELIAAERERQVSVEGWTPEHDDNHTSGQMVQAAAVYAKCATGLAEDISMGNDPSISALTHHHEVLQEREHGWTDMPWPWSENALKLAPDPIRNLVKAGALIAAEIDRLQRLEPTP